MAIRIGDKMTAIMSKKGITQKELARMTGITQSNLSHIQNNNRSPSTEKLVEIANALDCSTDKLLDRQV